MRKFNRNNVVVNNGSELPMPYIIVKPYVNNRKRVNNVVIRKQACSECFREYCKKSTIHGLQYLGEESYSKWEKFFWFVVVIVSMSFCTRMVYIFWNKWQESPIIVSFDDKKSQIWTIPFPAITICPEGLKPQHFNMSLMLVEENELTREEIFWIVALVTSGFICAKMVQNHWIKWGETPVIVSFNDRQTEIWRIPFPAITICPENKADGKSFDDNILKATEDSLTREEKIIKQSITMVCDNFQNWTRVEDLVATENDIIETLENLTPPLGFDASWQNQPTKMETVLLDQGICYTFNMLKPSEIYDDKISLSKRTFQGNNNSKIDRNWDRENGYIFDRYKEDYPKRSFGPGTKLSFGLLIIPTDSLSSCSVFQGYKVSVHPPDSVPQLTSNYFRLPLSQDVVAAITPSMLTTSNGVKAFSPEKRQCYFSGERSLKYFKLYTSNNCEIECITDFTLKQCNCVLFAMPKLEGTRVCVTTSELECTFEAEDLFLSPGYSRDGFRPMQSDCNCLPHCTHIEYNVESSSTNFDKKVLSKSFEDYPELRNIVSLESITSISFFYKEASFLTSKRSELYGLSEFVASCGGLFGLFLGMSVLSFAEILYFSIIRVLSNHFRNKH